MRGDSMVVYSVVTTFGALVNNGIGIWTYLKVPQSKRTVSVKDARCGARCSVCSAFFEGKCPSCVAADETIKKECKIYVCAQKKGINCHQCKTILKCDIYAEYKEKCPFSHLLNWVPSGNSYRLDSPTYSMGRALFRDRLVCGDFGLVVSREHPTTFFREWDLEQVPLLWLSVLEETMWTVNPTNLVRLTHAIADFIKEYPVSCILFEGVEYLVVYNTFEPVMEFLYSLDSIVAQDKSRFILSYDSRAFDEEKITLLEKGLTPLEIKGNP